MMTLKKTKTVMSKQYKIIIKTNNIQNLKEFKGKINLGIDLKTLRKRRYDCAINTNGC